MVDATVIQEAVCDMVRAGPYSPEWEKHNQRVYAAVASRRVKGIAVHGIDPDGNVVNIEAARDRWVRLVMNGLS